MKKPKKRRQQKLTQPATTLKEDLGKLLLDVGKILLGGFVIGVILRYEIPRDILLTIGVSATIVAFVVGLIMGKKNKNDLPLQRNGEYSDSPRHRSWRRKRSDR